MLVILLDACASVAANQQIVSRREAWPKGRAGWSADLVAINARQMAIATPPPAAITLTVFPA